jgi:hypothetical protein
MKVIVLAVICVVLLVSTIGALALYLPAQSEIDQRDATIAGLEEDIADAQDEIDSTDSQIQTYKNQISALEDENEGLQDDWDTMNATMYDAIDEYNDASDIFNLDLSSTLYTDDEFDLEAKETETLWSGTINYAGYVAVSGTSEASSTYVEVTCLFGDTYNLAYNQTIGTDDTVVFAVLPGTVTVKIGVLNEASTSTLDPTVIYYY